MRKGTHFQKGGEKTARKKGFLTERGGKGVLARTAPRTLDGGEKILSWLEGFSEVKTCQAFYVRWRQEEFLEGVV